MIVSKLQGGLGNQLFQWAYAKASSIKFKIDFLIDINFYSEQKNVTIRNFELNKFPNVQFKVLDIKCNNFIKLTDNFFYNDFYFDKSKNYYIDGFWQTEKYFKEYENEIKCDLSPTKEIKKELHKIIPENNNSVSLHVRRTDYLNSNGFHPIQDNNYYTTALNYIGDYDNLYIFSDDIMWCKENLDYKNMVFIEGNDSVTDIWLQSFCKNNIIANSSFSWWGAWLNNNKNKKIISPNKWFGNNVQINTKDIIPDGWIKI